MMSEEHAGLLCSKVSSLVYLWVWMSKPISAYHLCLFLKWLRGHCGRKNWTLGPGLLSISILQ
ncbi:hypothetical protein ASPZODRAFT_750641 [Penicilliopsis zonata CBS 506.65]|uniref:Uncharacterized protein n=1 Tax=Penicilliopsis zonata CBS 506.65 TaxID=1073090 RepID=A0A1L9SAP9_9EURO|nr:hypothetical protein ASPZODRAFT_750641 [Penicilliopsis zonata CBS 506.65]OJJ44228.1 hypothetical protein ASPZODRAFT_750641 [Penicilliopsis zonata CBS 506.65]